MTDLRRFARFLKHLDVPLPSALKQITFLFDFFFFFFLFSLFCFLHNTYVDYLDIFFLPPIKLVSRVRVLRYYRI